MRRKPWNLTRLQTETPLSFTTENKRVTVCEQIRIPQFPSGDDVSGLHPLRSSVGVWHALVRPLDPSIWRIATMQIENGCFIMQG
jgi:hypothetical protein